ncbi:ABCA1 [Mytilus edulis]|uniref:ABCA1 n=1 Tax=Mytilus edulis TaxID=6550 RepID=A0A8S3SWV7_MYTED|nr:ABCA1 [Mytilus edulis]
MWLLASSFIKTALEDWKLVFKIDAEDETDICSTPVQLSYNIYCYQLCNKTKPETNLQQKIQNLKKKLAVSKKDTNNTNTNIYDLYMDSEVTYNINDNEAQNLTHPNGKHFKSDVINYWSVIDIDQVKVFVYQNGVERVFLDFNGTGTDKTNWFSQERLQNSSYSDLKTANHGIGYYFSIEGDAGWLEVQIHICSYESPNKLMLLYSPTSIYMSYNEKHKRSLISAPDNRNSSKTMGFVGTASIVFDKEHKNGLESHVKYSIRMNQDRVDTTNKIQNRFIFAISRTLPLFLVLAWVLSVAMICKNIVYEKEMRLKEIMKIMGLGNGVHWLAWFIDAFIVMFISLILMVIILKGLSSSVAFGFACSYVARYEEQAIGIQWSNIGDTPIVDDDYSCLNCIIMMIVDAIIYGLFTWYIEAVFPGNANVEEEPKNKKVGVSIRNLKKVYKTGNKVAVDGLSINFYEGQISSFLGHNGAGKTTTILTVEEHLWFYARLKNLEPEKVKREMVRMIQDVGLPHKKKELSSSLSGGRFAKPVTRLSFRRKKKKSFLKMLAIKGKNPKVDSEELMDDTESVISVPTSERSIETGFSHKDHVKHTGARLKLQQFKAIFLKRFHRLRPLFILASMALAKIRPPSFGEPPLELQPWMYTPQKGAPNLYTFFSNDGNDFGVGADLTKTLLTKPWMGNRCMDPKIKQIRRESFIDVTIAICMIFAMSFIPASFVMVLIEERSSNSKHLQFVSGVNPFIYWLANFLWDMELKNVNAILKKAFLLLPQYCLGRGLTDMSRNQLWADNSDIISPGSYEKVWKSPFEFDQVGRNLLSMFCVGILFFILNLLIEYNFFLSRSWSCFWNSKPNFKSLADEDIDVTNERKRINNKQTKEDVLIIDNLTKEKRSKSLKCIRPTVNEAWLTTAIPILLEPITPPLKLYLHRIGKYDGKNFSGQKGYSIFDS